MEGKLKGMKVADLKAILQQANVAFDSKLTKPGLIKKIMETPEAAALASGPEDDDVPDLPSEDWDRGAKAAAAAPKIPASTPAAPTPTNNPVVKATPTREPPSTPAAGVPASSPKPMDGLPPSGEASKSLFTAALPDSSLEDEAAKRRARAAKWGTQYVEPSAQPAKKAASPKEVVESEEKRKAREARFGTAKPTAPIDDEEARKRKAREERFGPNKKPRLSPAPAA